MKKSILILILVFGSLVNAFSQIQEIEISSKKPSALEILTSFKNHHNINFSYDADQISKIRLTILSPTISFSDFKELMSAEHGISLNKVSENEYLIVINTTPVHFCGTVTVEESGFKLPGATIMNGDTILAVTDDNGKFSVNLPINTILTIRYEGMVKTTTSVQKIKNNCLPIVLSAKITQLEEVIVTDYLTQGIVKNQNSAIKVTPKSLSILPGLVEPDIFQSLQLIPGVSSPGEDATNLHIRGGTPDQNLVLYDGIKMYLNDHLFKQVSCFNPYIIKDVTVFRGGTSVQYGDRISGVIDIKSTDDLFDDLEVGGGLNLTSADAYLKIPVSKKLGVLIAGRRSSTDLYKTFTYNKLLEKIFQNSRLSTGNTNEPNITNNSYVNYYFSDINFKAIWKPKYGHTLQFSLINIKNELDAARNIVDNTYTRSIGDKLNQKNIGIGFSWTNAKPNRTKKKFETYFSSYSSEYSYDSSINNDEAYFNLLTANQNSVIDIGYNLFFEIPFNKKHSLTLGQQSTAKNINNKDNIEIAGTPFDEKIKKNYFIGNDAIELTAYSEYKYRSEKLFFSFGLRASVLNYYTTFLMEPRLYTSKKITDKLRITASAELKNQSSSQFFLARYESEFISSLPISNNSWNMQVIDLFNLDVTIIKSKQVTTGLLFNHKGWNIEVEAYYKDITNALSLNDDIIPAIYGLQERNEIKTGNSKRFGIDILLKKRYNNYRIWTSYTYSRSANKFKDIQQKVYPEPFNQPHQLNISQTYFWKNFEFGLGWTLASGLPFTPVLKGDIANLNSILSQNQINSQRLPQYHRLDISALHNFKIGHKLNGRVGFAFRNLYGRQKPIKKDYAIVYSNEGNSSLIARDKRPLGFVGDFVLRLNF